jgi:hypothetical protein
LDVKDFPHFLGKVRGSLVVFSLFSREWERVFYGFLTFLFVYKKEDLTVSVS